MQQDIKNKGEKMAKTREGSVWYDKKRPFCGLPLSFTKYELTKDRLFIERGLINTTYDEIRLYKIKDVSLSRNLIQKIFKVGTLHVCSSDSSLKDFKIEHIKNPKDVMELLSQNIEIQRDAHRVVSREIMTDCDDDEFEND